MTRALSQRVLGGGTFSKGGSRLSRVQGCFCAAWHVSEFIGTVTQTAETLAFLFSLSPPLNICVALVTFALLLLSTCVLFLYLFPCDGLLSIFQIPVTANNSEIKILMCLRADSSESLGAYPERRISGSQRMSLCKLQSNV